MAERTEATKILERLQYGDISVETAEKLLAELAKQAVERVERELRTANARIEMLENAIVLDAIQTGRFMP